MSQFGLKSKIDNAKIDKVHLDKINRKLSIVKKEIAKILSERRLKEQKILK